MGYYRGAGDCMYGRGDYYRGDYYQGDLWGSLKKIGGTIFGAAKGFVTGGPVGAVAGGAAALLKRPSIQTPAPSSFQFNSSRFVPDIGVRIGGPSGLQVGVFNPPPAPMLPQHFGPPVGTMLPPSQGGFIQACGIKGTRPNKAGYYKQVRRGDPSNVVYIPKGSVCVKTRRINIANGRALRRAVRRAQGFAKMARRVMTFVNARAPRGRAKFKRKR